jgi:hypothetical protein
MIETMLYKIRNASPFTIFWIAFYGCAITALIVPWNVGKGLAYVAFTPSLILAIVVAVGVPLAVLLGLWEWAVKRYREKKSSPESGH